MCRTLSKVIKYGLCLVINATGIVETITLSQMRIEIKGEERKMV